MELKRTVTNRMPKGRDLETHVSLVEIGGERFAEIADFIVSREEYGRGYHIPVQCLPEAVDGLTGLAVKIGLGSVLLGANRG